MSNQGKVDCGRRRLVVATAAVGGAGAVAALVPRLESVAQAAGKAGRWLAVRLLQGADLAAGGGGAGNPGLVRSPRLCRSSPACFRPNAPRQQALRSKSISASLSQVR